MSDTAIATLLVGAALLGGGWWFLERMEARFNHQRRQLDKLYNALVAIHEKLDR